MRYLCLCSSNHLINLIVIVINYVIDIINYFMVMVIDMIMIDFRDLYCCIFYSYVGFGFYRSIRNYLNLNYVDYVYYAYYIYVVDFIINRLFNYVYVYLYVSSYYC